jgi:hypothetical protein
MGIVIFIAAVIWGLLAAQFMVQAITSFVLAFVYLSGLMFSRVSKSLNATGILVSLVQAIVFLVLFFGGNGVTSKFIDYDSWNANSIASTVAVLLSLIYCGVQVPGKFLLARLSAWEPYFVQAANTFPPAQRIAYAKKYRSKSPA